jgi:hypothetical protein
MRVGKIAAFGAVLVLWAVPANVGAQGIGEIGGPPTMGAPLPFPPPHKKTPLLRAKSEAIVIGVGVGAFGRVEIVGQDTEAGLCIFVEHPEQGTSSDSCGQVSHPSLIAVRSATFEIGRRRGRSLSEAAGSMQPGVAAVTAIGHPHKGRERRRKAVSGIVAVPSSDLLARLHQATPFGYFVADFRGCLADAKIEVQAFDAAGVLLGSSGVPSPTEVFPRFEPCHPGSSSVFFHTVGNARTTVSP